jgi:hypothetical protein
MLSAVLAEGEGVRRFGPFPAGRPPSAAVLLFVRSCCATRLVVDADVAVVVVVVVVVVAALTTLVLSARRRGLKRLFSAWILLRGLCGGLLGPSEPLVAPGLLLPLVLIPGECDWGTVPEDENGEVMLALPRLCFCCWSKLGRPPMLGRVGCAAVRVTLARSTLGRGRCVGPGPVAWPSVLGLGRARSRLGRARSVLVRRAAPEGLSIDGRARWSVVSMGGSQGRGPRWAAGLVTTGVVVVVVAVVVVVRPSFERRRGGVALEREEAVGLNKELGCGCDGRVAGGAGAGAGAVGDAAPGGGDDGTGEVGCEVEGEVYASAEETFREWAGRVVVVVVVVEVGSGGTGSGVLRLELEDE